MDEGRVEYNDNGSVVTLVFSRPEARNAMTPAMFTQLDDACTRLEANSEVRVVVLRGAGGKAFVAGADIEQFTRFESAEDGLGYERRTEAVIARLEALPHPTLAVVEGWAVGGGLTIAGVCDLRVCTPDARFGVPVARTLGNCLSIENYTRLNALFGSSRVKQLIFNANFFDAHEAKATGFVMEVIEREDIEDRIEAITDRLLQHSPLTMRITKEALNRINRVGGVDGDDLIRLAYGSRDFRHGVESFLAKETPEWEGR